MESRILTTVSRSTVKTLPLRFYLPVLTRKGRLGEEKVLGIFIVIINNWCKLTFSPILYL